MARYKKKEDGEGWIVTFETHASSIQALNANELWNVSTEDELSNYHKVGSGKIWMVSVLPTLNTPVGTVKPSIKKPEYIDNYIVTFYNNKECYSRIDRPFTIEEFRVDILRKRLTPVPVPFDNEQPVEYHYVARISEKGEKNDLLTILLNETCDELRAKFESESE